MTVEISFTWEVEDGYVGHGTQDATLELNEDEARELLDDDNALQERMDGIAEEAFRQSITHTLSDNAVPEAMSALREAVDELSDDE